MSENIADEGNHSIPFSAKPQNRRNCKSDYDFKPSVRRLRRCPLQRITPPRLLKVYITDLDRHRFKFSAQFIFTPVG